jgi:hypothetical protein
MMPEDADTLAAIVSAVDGAGGRIRGTEIDHKAKGGLGNAIAMSLGGQPTKIPVFTLEIVADPAVVLDGEPEETAADMDGDEKPPLARARTRIENLEGEGIDEFTKRQALQVIEDVSVEQVEITFEEAPAEGGEQR